MGVVIMGASTFSLFIPEIIDAVRFSDRWVLQNKFFNNNPI